jgi:hypothetical protein
VPPEEQFVRVELEALVLGAVEDLVVSDIDDICIVCQTARRRFDLEGVGHGVRRRPTGVVRVQDGQVALRQVVAR